jgi:hypothetical protein
MANANAEPETPGFSDVEQKLVNFFNNQARTIAIAS